MGIGLRKRDATWIATGAVYFLATSAAIASTRFDGGFAFLWVATAILTARLTTLRRQLWLPTLLVCGIASIVATTWLGLGPRVAVPLAIINVGEAVLGAVLLHRAVGRRPVLDSHQWLMNFVIVAGMIAPGVAALCAGSVVTLMLGKPFLPNTLHWYSGHALGTLAFMPIAMMVMRGEATRLLRAAKRPKLVELSILMLLVVGVSIVTFAQDRLPLLFLPMLPIVLATFRGGPLSTASSIVIISVVGAVFTLDGHGPIVLMHAGTGIHLQFLQFYIAATMLTVLPANAELERRAELFRRLRDSEARYRVLTDNSTDIVLNLDVDGRLRYVSPSIRQIGGHDPASLIGTPVAELVHPEDRASAIEGHRHTLANPEGVTVGEFRARTLAGDLRWFETHSRPVLDDDGTILGVVSAARDITHRKAHEERLSRAALTDPLTGLANRRAFRDELDLRLETHAGGCVALFDLDHFKQINDAHGHPVGDEVLRRFAAIARSSVRDQDIVARIGGEEFAVILPDATIDQARLVCDRLRAAVGIARFPIGERALSITVSGGVAAYHHGLAVETLLGEADAALYRAKAAGRDRLALAA